MKIRWWMIVIGVVAILGVVYLVLALTAEPAGEHPFFSEGQSRPWVIAHQGGERLWPSDTLYAMERAVELGADVLEMDIHSTKDGHLVVMHDETVDRTTDSTGAIQDKTLVEIKQLDAGYYWTADDETYPFRDKGITVPTLEEIFTAFPDRRMNIEIKQADPSITVPLCELVAKYQMGDLVLIASFDQASLDEFREVCPGIATSTGRSEVISFFILSTLFLENVISPDAFAIQVPEYEGSLKVLTNRFVDAAHNRNLEVHAWTINEDEDMRRLLDLGLDGIITDYPDRLLSVVGR